jgi:hypothetical protein
MKKHWHKALFDFEQILIANSLTQLQSDFNACKFIKHPEKYISSHLKDINMGKSTLKLKFFFFWYLQNIIDISFQKFISPILGVQI